MYETIMGSIAYGVSSDESDRDIYGFCIPPKEEVFPHLDGEIPGFDAPKKRFAQYQQMHVEDASARGGKGVDYDLTIYSIVKYMSLCMEQAKTPQECVRQIRAFLDILDFGLDSSLRPIIFREFVSTFKARQKIVIPKVRKKSTLAASLWGHS